MTDLTDDIKEISGMADLPEQDLWIGSVMQQNVYLHWQDVKDICTKEVSKAYDQTKEENAKLKADCHLLAQKLLQVKPELRDWLKVNYGKYL